MKGVVYTQPGPPEVLKIMNVEKPVPKDNQVLIRVNAVALSNTDYKRFKETAVGEKPTFSTWLTDNVMLKAVGKVIGAEVSGIIEKVGGNVRNIKLGDEVFAIADGLIGGWAEYVCANDGEFYRKPGVLSFEEAAALPVTGATALGAVRAAKVQPEQSVLVYGASGGVGLYVAQIVKAMGAVVTGVCSTRNVEILHSFGIDNIIDYKKEDFSRKGVTYDAIIAVNGYNPISTYKKLLKPNGNYIAIGGAKQATEAPILGSILSLGSGKRLGAATYFAIKNKGLPYLKKLVDDGRLKPIIDKTYPVESIATAIRDVLASHAQGKVAITVDFS